MIISCLKNLKSIVFVGALTVAISSAAMFSYHDEYPNSAFYIDLNSNSRNVGTWVETVFNQTVKYSDLAVFNNAGAPKCFDVSTYSATGTPQNTDTRIFAQESETVWRSVNDDYQGYRTSQTRLWVLPMQVINLRFSVYSPGYNTIDFSATISKNPESESTCQGPGSYLKGVSNSVYPQFVVAN